MSSVSVNENSVYDGALCLHIRFREVLLHLSNNWFVIISFQMKRVNVHLHRRLQPPRTSAPQHVRWSVTACLWLAVRLLSCSGCLFLLTCVCFRRPQVGWCPEAQPVNRGESALISSQQKSLLPVPASLPRPAPD